MAYGDVSGAVTELIVTCQTPASGSIGIQEGDAVVLTGDYEVNNTTEENRPIFGQALAAASGNSVQIAVKVRGVAVFSYSGGREPRVDGDSGIVTSRIPGGVQGHRMDMTLPSQALNIMVDQGEREVHVLL